MLIIKRNGTTEPYNKEKIVTAVRKNFASTGKVLTDEVIHALIAQVERMLNEQADSRSVECIQDEVERCLMEQGFYAEAKSYILYRWQRTEKRNAINQLVTATQTPEIAEILKLIQTDFPAEEYSLKLLAEKFASFRKTGMGTEESLTALTKAAVELTTQEAPNWEFIAARLLDYQLTRRLRLQEEKLGLPTFYDKLRYLTDEGLYGDYILSAYSPEEIGQAASFIRPERNRLFNYSGLDLLTKRYLIRTHRHELLESVQEMYLGIALHLALPEPTNRMHWVQQFYDMLSRLEVTMATPTLSNSRKPYHQLSR